MFRRAFVRLALVGTALAVLLPGIVVGQGPTTTVYLVRHAEKGTTPAGDPPLTEAGMARARALAALLADSGVTAVITTDLVRTKDTGQPLAMARKIVPLVVSVRGTGTAAHVTAVADAVRSQGGGAVLVVGHSNTIPMIIEALGGGPQLPICDAAYANLFTMRLNSGGAPKLTSGKYGAADPDGSNTCVPKP